MTFTSHILLFYKKNQPDTRSNSYINPAPSLGDCFLSNIFFLQVKIVEAILNHSEGFISATRQLVKFLHYIHTHLKEIVVFDIRAYL